MAIALVLPAIASAAQVTERSIGLSSATAGAEGVTYSVAFTPVSSAGAFVVDFCANSPLIGNACTAPTNFDATSASVTTPAATGITSPSVTGAASQVTVTGAMTGGSAVTVNLAGIDNPSTVGNLYARIITYDTAGNAGDYTSQVLGDGVVDQGGVALAIHDGVSVSGVVLETLTFCVSGEVIDEDCDTTTAPVLELGEPFGDVIALQPGTLSEGSMYTQISTNAVGGVVVHLKSDALDCGGLLLISDPSVCHIAPALNNDILEDPDAALFGVKAAAATPTSGVPTASGAFQPVTGTFYDTLDPGPAEFAMNYVAGNVSGVTSTFGDPFLDTADAPVNNMNMMLTFGASATNDTPAGTYRANLSLIAVGKF